MIPKPSQIAPRPRSDSMIQWLAISILILATAVFATMYWVTKSALNAQVKIVVETKRELQLQMTRSNTASNDTFIGKSNNESAGEGIAQAKYATKSTVLRHTSYFRRTRSLSTTIDGRRERNDFCISAMEVSFNLC